MSEQLTPKQALALWDLIISGEEPAIMDYNILSASQRRPLEVAGLIRLEERERIQPGKKTTKRKHIVLNDKAWDWAIDNFTVKLSLSKYSTLVLGQLLNKLGYHLKERDISLSEFLAVPKTKSLEEKIRNAHASITESSFDSRARLSKIHQYLEDISPQKINDTLRSMQQAGEVSLSPMEDPQEIGPEDEQAAIDLGGGDKRYFIYIK
ncbi:hypothetical protein [Leptothoe sp. PORK10 BA2]|uniref:hypothetical protein n=1 Tax=Leptothoe sp. PORK10 BA2 TaxID=3110254 RepID=UPI002B21C38A|nr:hypothetical protein [Leptothoe sp. PORK10 BA2]MEA5462543.1 hypothetical protein [Leptothoe sp. PORK10 BA2]